MLVPDRVAEEVDDAMPAERIALPGAYTSRQDPKLLKPDRASLASVDPTVIAFGSEAGEKAQASALLLPAAAMMTTP